MQKLGMGAMFGGDSAPPENNNRANTDEDRSAFQSGITSNNLLM